MAGERALIQERIDAVPPERYQATLLDYGLCGNGVVGLTARQIPRVVVRAHDCIAMLMGSAERYESYYAEHSGVYFRSPGWLERGENTEQLTLEDQLNELASHYGKVDILFQPIATARFICISSSSPARRFRCHLFRPGY